MPIGAEQMCRDVAALVSAYNFLPIWKPIKTNGEID